MKDFMRYIATGCIAFTFSCAFALFFSQWGVFPPFNGSMVVGMMLISTAIMTLIYLTHLLPIENALVARVIELFSVLFVLILAGSIFNFFPFTFYYTMITILIGVLTYIVVTIVIFVGDQTTAQRINTVIQKRKMEEFNE